MKRQSKLVLIIISAVLAVAISYLFPSNVGKSLTVDNVKISEEKAYVAQEITSVTLKPERITKIYYRGTLVGILHDTSLLAQTIESEKEKLNGTAFEGYNVSLDQDVYTITENSFWNYENKDGQIIRYLIDNDMFVIKAYEIDICLDEDVKDIIYVKSLDDFKAALQKFVLCFTDQDTYVKLSNHEDIIDLSTYGIQDINVYIEEVIKAKETGANVDEVYTDVDSIFKYLCYGKDYELEYYTVPDYETVQGAASKNALTATQLIAINDNLYDINQPLVKGQKLNITYFNSPISVVVEQQRYVKEVTYPSESTYTFDEKLKVGEVVEDVAPATGYNDALYTDIYVNGIISGYRQEMVKVVVEPTVGSYRFNNAAVDNRGIFFSLPCYNAYIYCDFYGYSGHHGVDFINLYNPYGEVLACCDATIIERAYSSSMGNYYYVDCGKGIIMRYLHMNVPGYYPVGTEIVRGQVIGQIGNTGIGSGPHIDVGVYIDGQLVDPCTVLPCDQAGRK